MRERDSKETGECGECSTWNKQFALHWYIPRTVPTTVFECIWYQQFQQDSDTERKQGPPCVFSYFIIYISPILKIVWSCLF